MYLIFVELCVLESLWSCAFVNGVMKIMMCRFIIFSCLIGEYDYVEPRCYSLTCESW